MRERGSGHRVEVGWSAEPEAMKVEAGHDTPLRIALLGDFSAREHRGQIETGAALAARESLAIDRDNFDDVLARLAPEVRLRLGSGTEIERMRLTALDDFHPDRIYEGSPIFAGVRELRSHLAQRSEPPPRASVPPPSASQNLLEQVLEQSSEAQAERSPLEGGDLQEYLNRIVAAHVVPSGDPRSRQLLAEVETAAAAGMRALLHYPDFQALEALWRGLFLLTRRIESDVDVRLHVIDVSKAELAADQATSGDALYRLLTEGTQGEKWDFLVGLYSFGPESADLALLAGLAGTARVVGAPWIAGADPLLVGCPSFAAAPDPDDWRTEAAPAWARLRRSADARWIGLALPRFLLRLPYGTEGEGTYLWGHPAIVCVLLLTQAFGRFGRPLHAGMDLEVDALPLHLIKTATGVRMMPCAEVLLGERGVMRILESGLMPVASVRDTDRVRMVRFQSIADPLAPLAAS